MQTTYLDFERPLEELDKQVYALSQLENRSEQQQTELAALEERLRQCEAEVFTALSPWATGATLATPGPTLYARLY